MCIFRKQREVLGLKGSGFTLRLQLTKKRRLSYVFVGFLFFVCLFDQAQSHVTEITLAQIFVAPHTSFAPCQQMFLKMSRSAA